MTNFSYFKISYSHKIRYLKLYQKKATYIVFLHGFKSDLEGKKPRTFYKFAKKRKSGVLSIVGKPNGYAAKNSDVSVVIPVKNQKLLTPFSESYQAVIWHLLVSHPDLKETETKWESVIEKK